MRSASSVTSRGPFVGGAQQTLSHLIWEIRMSLIGTIILMVATALCTGAAAIEGRGPAGKDTKFFARKPDELRSPGTWLLLSGILLALVGSSLLSGANVVDDWWSTPHIPCPRHGSVRDTSINPGPSEPPCTAAVILKRQKAPDMTSGVEAVGSGNGLFCVYGSSLGMPRRWQMSGPPGITAAVPL
jgi:hypothetical protein